MLVQPNDSRLTALLLGELSDAERAALEAKAADSPQLAETLDGLRQTAAALRRELAAEPCPHLTQVQRELVLREIAAAGASGGVTSSSAWGALITSFGWGSWGAWLALATTALLLTTGLMVWHLGHLTRVEQPVDTVPSQPDVPEVAERDVRKQRAVPVVAADAELPLIVLHVGESVPLNVFGRIENGREVRLVPDRLVWSTDPLAGYVDFEPNSLTLRGLAATPQPVLLTVRFNGLTARARVRVIPKLEEQEDGSRNPSH